jgi:hypothetical protein
MQNTRKGDKMKNSLFFILILLLPSVVKPQQKGRYYIAGVDNDSTFLNFYSDFKNAVVNRDSIKIANLILYPNTFYYGNNKTFPINDKKSFLKLYSKIFNNKLKQLIINAKDDSLFANSSGIMLGNGQIWFNEVLIHGKWVLKIFTLNNNKYLYER